MKDKNNQKVAFIVCTNNEAIMSETEKYIDNLYLPEGMEKEVIKIRDACSMTEGYNRALKRSNAKYKVYMHQDVFILNKTLIADCMDIFSKNPEVGLLGLIGCQKLPQNGIWWEGTGCKGKTLEDNLQSVKLLDLGDVKECWEPAQAVDGQIMITQYDIPWREDICQGWHFYDTSQCLEFARYGYKVAIVRQEKPWVMHECGVDINSGYEVERQIFVAEYKDQLERRDRIQEESISALINENRWEEAKEHLEAYKVSGGIYSDSIAILDASICLWEDRKEEAFVCISKGLAFNYQNYELYFMLGNYYLEKNKNQAFLCYETAEFYCKNEDRAYLTEVKNSLLLSDEVTVQPVSIVILSYNGKEMTSLCVDSLRQSIPADAYELVIIDNASTDGSIEWLKQEEKVTKNLKVLYNKKNNGFPGGCNQGIKAAERKNDIFLLNNDTVAPPNAVFWLRMGLYENPRIGAVGSVSNHANNDQMIKEKLDGCEAYYAYGIKRNIPMIYPYEKKAWLMGFAVMFKREALEDVGYLDERFSPGNYEDNDIGIRFLRKGYLQLLCKNSFIFHFGSVGFRRNQDAFDRLLRCNRQKLKEKYELPIDEYSWVRTDMLDLIGETSDKRLSILDVGCGLGATMAKAESLFPNSVVVGIEKEEKIASIGKNLADVRWGDIEVMKLPFEKNSFDYILLGNVLEYLKQPEKVIESLVPFLKTGGHFIISVSSRIEKNQVQNWILQVNKLRVEVFRLEKIDYIVKCIKFI
ncbi:MAG: glycosyltransferase [Acetivibrio ethanolgignens]